MTPHQFIAAWHHYCHLPVPRYVADGWLRTATVMMERGITDADLELVARWMRREIRKSENGERGSVPYSVASLRFTLMFGKYGDRPEEDLGERFFELLALAESCRPKPKPVPQNIVPLPEPMTDEQRREIAGKLRAFMEGQR